MKIAIVVFDITKMAGTERAVCNLANMLILNSNKYVPVIISISSIRGNAQYDLDKNIVIHHMGLNLSKSKIKRLFEYRTFVKNCRKICLSENIAILLGTAHGLNIFLPFIKNKLLKTIASEHMNYMAAPFFSRAVRRIIYPLIDAVVVLTSSDAKNYAYHKNVKVIPNSLSFIPEKRADLTHKRILAVGRLTNQKGFDMLIEAVSLIKSQCDGWEVKIIGSGEDEEHLQRQIDRLHLNKLVTISQPTKDMINEYINASIFVLSSRYEGLPMVLIEAKSCGLPIVSFNCPNGPAEIVNNNEDGFLVARNDISQLANCISELITNQKKRIIFGNKAIENGKKYDPANINVLWDNLFCSL
jgi:glycosyltransferase involved in cell wall biosynthesis